MTSLVHDHRALDESCAAALTALRHGDLRVVHNLWTVFCVALATHCDEEERALTAAGAEGERMNRIIAQEHRHLRDRAGKITEQLARGYVRVGEVEDLHDVLRAHARHEEQMFARGRASE